MFRRVSRYINSEFAPSVDLLDQNMAFFTFYIVNKAGGLIFNKDLSPVAKLPTNDYLTNASKFHALHAIAKQLAPVLSGGITSIDAPTFSLYCLETPTGLKLFLTARPKMESTAQAFLGRAYEAYAEYALKVCLHLNLRVVTGLSQLHV